MKSKRLAVAIGLFFIVMFPASWQPMAMAQAKTVIKVAHESSVDHEIHLSLVFFAKKVAEKTKGEVEVKVFPAGQLGNEQAIYEGVKLGTIDAGTGGLYGTMDPMWEVINMPFLYRDYNHVQKVFDGPIGDELKKRALKNGYKVLAPFHNGFRYFYNNAKPIYAPEDLKGLRMRTPPMPVIIDTVKALGGVPQAIPYGEVYTATKQGVVDGGEQALASIVGMKFYEVMKYITLVPYLYNADVFIMNPKLWNSISPKMQKAIEESAREALAYQRKLFSERTDQAVDVILKNGVKVSVAYAPLFPPHVKEVYAKYEKGFPPGLIEQIRNIK